MTHPAMRVGPFDTHLSSKLFYAVSMHAMTKLPPLAAGHNIRSMREEIAELVRQRDIAQLGMTAKGANVALALKQITALSDDIEEREKALDALLGRNVATGAIEAAVEALTGVEDDQWPGAGARAYRVARILDFAFGNG